MKYYPVVVQAVAADDKNIIVYFSDGRITKYNMKPLIRQGGVFQRLEDETFFSNALTVLNDTAAWDISGRHDPYDCIDIDPMTLYNASQISDPLEADIAG